MHDTRRTGFGIVQDAGSRKDVVADVRCGLTIVDLDWGRFPGNRRGVVVPSFIPRGDGEAG